MVKWPFKSFQIPSGKTPKYGQVQEGEYNLSINKDAANVENLKGDINNNID